MSAPPRSSWARRWALVRKIAGTVPLHLRLGFLAGHAVNAVAGVLQPLALKWIVDGVTAADTALAVRGGVVLALASGAGDGAGRAAKDLMLYLSIRSGHQLSVETIRTIAGVPSLEHLEDAEHQDQVRLVAVQGRTAAHTLTNAVSSLNTVVGVIASIVLLVSVDPLLALFPAFVVPSIRLIPRVHRLRKQANEDAAEVQRSGAELHELFLDTDAAMEMRVFGATADLDDETDARWQRQTEVIAKGEARAAVLSAAGLAVLSLGYVAALAVVAWRAGGAATAAGSAVMVIALAGRLRWQLEGTINMGQQFRSSFEVLDRLIWLAAFRATGYSASPTAPVPAALTDGLQLRNVSFAYPGTDAEVLHDVSLDLPAGSVVALVGDNGAGKTTLIKLLCGFYRPTSGTITADGVDAATMPADEWQARVAGAFQDFLRLEDQFRHSVVPLVPGVAVGDDEVTAAAARGDALGFTTAWTDGLSTHLGKTYRDGMQLSGGEWQRVAVARAMHPSSPLLLVLDEPTAALDPAAEHRLYEHYSAAAREARERNGCITLLIRSRASTASPRSAHRRSVERETSRSESTATASLRRDSPVHVVEHDSCEAGVGCLGQTAERRTERQRRGRVFHRLPHRQTDHRQISRERPCILHEVVERALPPARRTGTFEDTERA